MNYPCGAGGLGDKVLDVPAGTAMERRKHGRGSSVGKGV